MLHLIDSSDPNYLNNYSAIKNELSKYGKNVNEKQEIIVLTKVDLLDKNIDKQRKDLKKICGQLPMSISSFSQDGIKELLELLFERCSK